MKVKKFINLQYVVDVKNYCQSFEKWIKIRSKYHQFAEEQKLKLFDKYLQVIKPIIHRFDRVIRSYPSNSFGFYSLNLHQNQVSIIKKSLKPLQQYEILFQNPQESIKNEQIEKSLIQQFDPIYRIDIYGKPNNSQLKWWGSGMVVDSIKIQGVVVSGKGQGKKNLGMPTANIELDINLQKKLDSYPNGVYLVDFDFLNGQSYRGAACLGTNPHYQNFQESRRIEVYVLHDFGDDIFYGSKVAVTFRVLIRFQGKFHSFDAFLNAMHNDIYIAGQFPSIKQFD